MNIKNYVRIQKELKSIKYVDQINVRYQCGIHTSSLSI